jgi:hypothetical protein
MVRVLLAFLIAVCCAALLGSLDGLEWPRAPLLLAMCPFILAGGLVMAPLFVSPKRPRHR